MDRDKFIDQIVEACMDESKFQYSYDLPQGSDNEGHTVAAMSSAILNRMVKEGELSRQWRRYVETLIDNNGVDPAGLNDIKYWQAIFAGFSTGYGAAIGGMIWNIRQGNITI